MSEIGDMYERIKNIVEDIDSAVLIKGGEGRRGFTVGGNKDHPQYIEVEFDGAVESEYKVKFLEIGNRTEWEFVDSDDVFSGDSGGIIVFERSIDPGEANAFNKFEESESL